MIGSNKKLCLSCSHSFNLFPTRVIAKTSPVKVARVTSEAAEASAAAKAAHCRLEMLTSADLGRLTQVSAFQQCVRGIGVRGVAPGWISFVLAYMRGEKKIEKRERLRDACGNEARHLRVRSDMALTSRRNLTSFASCSENA
jgi:hypothetical protein